MNIPHAFDDAASDSAPALPSASLAATSPVASGPAASIADPRPDALESPRPESPRPESPRPESPRPESPRLGAVDIVEAFTALRHELKLQVRGGRDLQQSLQESLVRIEQAVSERPRPADLPSAAAPTLAPSDDARKLAEALAEVEESLRRAVESVSRHGEATRVRAGLLERYEQKVAAASWWTRRLAGRFLSEVGVELVQAAQDERQADAAAAAMRQGLELLLARVHRLMQQCELERVDVLHAPFDAETMRAIDVIETSEVASSHVAEQLRPAYVWRGRLLRCADVRLAK